MNNPANEIVPVDVVIDVESDTGEPTRIENVLAPGFYWRAKADCVATDTTWSTPREVKIHAGDLHLMMDVFEHEGEVHSIIFLSHPRSGNYEYRMLVADFVANFEPVLEDEAESQRVREQAEIMGKVNEIQGEMAQAQVNPLALPDLQKKAEEAVKKFESEETARVVVEVKEREKREADLRRIHRRAARRSEAAGNPLVVRSATISDRIEVMVSEGITSEGVRELSLEAGRRIAVAQATAEWLKRRTELMSDTLKRLTPYYAEKGQVAIARSRKAITYVKQLTEGINSLKLYTGDDVTIVTVREGKGASSSEPLTLLQAKRYMDEELALFVDVFEDFDHHSAEFFFKNLRENDALLKQVLPMPRCVVSMATTRRNIEYSEKMSPYDRALNALRNKLVFLLVRDGENVHAVYSGEPSHEVASRLFPTQSDLDKPFTGVDGSSIGLKDVMFGKSVEAFDNLGLHYKRFLILLCGLDHNHKLLGEFYPPEEMMSFMSLPFQQKYFRFVVEDDASSLLSYDGALTVRAEDWIKECNKSLRSGSRIMATGGALAQHSPQIQRIFDMRVDTSRLPLELLVTRNKGVHCVSVPTIDRHHNLGGATVFLDDESAGLKDWFLCLDRVRLQDIRRYIWDRKSRVASISWLRLLRRAEVVLTDIEAQESALRDYLRKTAVEANVLHADDVEGAMIDAIATWRADHRGEAAPSVDNRAEVNKLLSLMYPSDKLADSMGPMVQAFLVQNNHTPLRLSRTGKNRFVLYVAPSASDREPYTTGVHFGWVKRLLLDVKKDRLQLASYSFVWLQEGVINAAEETLREWDGLKAWLNKKAEPVSLSALEKFSTSLREVSSLEPVLKAGRGEFLSDKEGAVVALSSDLFRQFHTGSITDRIVTLPVGVYTRKKDGAPVYLYAFMDLCWFLKRYGSKQDWENFSSLVYRLEKTLHSRRYSASWRLIGVSQPLKGLFGDQNDAFKVKVEALGWNKVSRHERGGTKRSSLNFDFYNKTTRAERREKKGSYHGAASDVPLSWNRAIDALMNVAPHLRREFYNSIEDRVRFIRWEPDSEQKRKEERRRPYVANLPQYVDLSSLIWSADRNRSMANAAFSVSGGEGKRGRTF